MKALIFGLGNPGTEYDNTRHNFGKMCVENFALHHNLTWTKFNNHGDFCKMKINDNEIFLLKTTAIYMNDSGILCKEFVDYFKIPTEEIIILYDDMDYALGAFRLKTTGSGGGHNGVASVLKYLNTNKLNRIRLGIGRTTSDNMKNYVIGKFTKQEMPIVNNVVETVSHDVLEEWLKNLNFDRLMTKFN